METVYNLSFDIGNVRCSLITAKPYQHFDRLSRAYYEHNHHFFELHAVTQGECSFLCEDTTVTVGKSDILLFPPQIYHKLTSVEGRCMKFCLSFHLTKEPKETCREDGGFYDAFFQKRTPILLKKTQPLEERIAEINRLLEAPNNFLVREQLKVACNALLLQLYVLLREKREQESTNVYSATPSDEYIIDNFFALNFMSNSSKELLAEQIHVSPRQLQRILKEKYGMNYREKLKEIRVVVATGLLLDSDKSMAEISEILGYSTPANFATFIKKATGKTPGQIRKDRTVCK